MASSDHTAPRAGQGPSKGQGDLLAPREHLESSSCEGSQDRSWGARTGLGEQVELFPLPTWSFSQLSLTAPSFGSQPPPEKRVCVGLIIPGEWRNSPWEVAHSEDVAISDSVEISDGHGPG